MLRAFHWRTSIQVSIDVDFLIFSKNIKELGHREPVQGIIIFHMDYFIISENISSITLGEASDLEPAESLSNVNVK